MMNKFFAIVLLGCVATELVGGVHRNLFGLKKKPAVVKEALKVVRPVKRVDFGALNRWLVGGLAGNPDVEANLAHLKENIGTLEGGLRKAGELVLSLTDNAHTCDSNVLNILIELDNARLKPNGLKRIEQLVGPSWTQVQEVCAKYVDEHYREADHDMGQFVSVMKQERYDDSAKLSDSKLAFKLKLLAEDDPKVEFYEPNELTGGVVANKDPGMFAYALDKYLLEPCKRLLDPEQLANHLLALTLADSYLRPKKWRANRTFCTNQPAAYSPENVMIRLRALAWQRSACESFVNMEPNRRARIIDAMYD